MPAVILGLDPDKCDHIYPRTRDGRCQGCGSTSCAAPKDRTLAGLGGPRCGKPATMRRDGRPWCDDCWEDFLGTTRRGENLLGILLGRDKSH